MENMSLTLDDFLSRFQLLRPQINRESLNLRQAAVLIPVVRRPQPGLLLTQRSVHLRKHAGQVAFPGGAVDSTDASLIAAALRAPICQIAANAGVEGAVILDKVSKSKSVNYGYDAAHDTFGDMIDNGIVDPTKVCRSALENAASVSSMVLTTESLVADLPEKAAPAAPAAPDMGGMY